METETIDTWAIQIAEAAAPEEAEMAPIMVQAYLKGGKDRQGLFLQAQGDIVGGFGAADLQTILPWILNGLAVIAPLINAALTSGNVDKYLSAVKDVLEIGDHLSRKKKVESLPDVPYLDLKKVVAVLPKELAKAKIPQEQCELITYHVIRELLKDPNSAKHVQKLVGAKNEHAPSPVQLIKPWQTVCHPLALVLADCVHYQHSQTAFGNLGRLPARPFGQPVQFLGKCSQPTRKIYGLVKPGGSVSIRDRVFGSYHDPISKSTGFHSGKAQWTGTFRPDHGSRVGA